MYELKIQNYFNPGVLDESQHIENLSTLNLYYFICCNIFVLE